MTAREQLIAYLATLVILLLVLIAALIAAAVAPQVAGKMEVFGLGTITGGLIGVLRIPSQSRTTIDNAPNDPVPTAPQPTDPEQEQRP